MTVMTTTMTTSRRVAMIVSSPLRSKRLNSMAGLLSSFDERLFLPSLKPVSSPRQNRASNIDGQRRWVSAIFLIGRRCKTRLAVRASSYGRLFQRRVLRRQMQLLLTFSEEGSRQLKLFWASLTLQGPEWIDPTFSRSRIKRRDQREKVAISNRLPRFRIKASSALALFLMEL